MCFTKPLPRLVPAAAVCLALLLAARPSLAAGEAFELIEHYPIDSRTEVAIPVILELDMQTTSDGDGSLRVETAAPVTIPLLDTGPLAVTEATLLYRAMLRSQGLEGRAYLEMLCEFKGKGEFFSRAINASISGSSDWLLQRTSFFLKEDEQPDNVRLNLVIEGKGTVWVDDVRLLKGPLQ
jgi:hypothetical protein